jgi:hypothetical protein
MCPCTNMRIASSFTGKTVRCAAPLLMRIAADSSCRARSSILAGQRSILLCNPGFACEIEAAEDHSLGHAGSIAMNPTLWNAQHASMPYDLMPYPGSWYEAGWTIEWAERNKGSLHTNPDQRPTGVGASRFDSNLELTCKNEHACEALSVHCPSQSKCDIDCSQDQSIHHCGQLDKAKMMRVYVHHNAPYRIKMNLGWNSASNYGQIVLYWELGSTLATGGPNPCAGKALGDPSCSTGPTTLVPCASGIVWDADIPNSGERERNIMHWDISKNDEWNCGGECISNAQVLTCGAASPTNQPTTAPTSAPSAAPTVAPTAAPTEAPTATPSATPTAVPTAAPTPQPTPAPVRPAPCVGTPGAGYYGCSACTESQLGVTADADGFEGCACFGSVGFNTGRGSTEILSFCFPRDGFATRDPALAPATACLPPADRCQSPTNISDALAFFQRAYYEHGALASNATDVPPLDTAATWAAYLCELGARDGRPCVASAGAICAEWAKGEMCVSCADAHYRETGGGCARCAATDPLRAIGLPLFVFFCIGLVVFILAVVTVFLLLLCKNVARLCLSRAVERAAAAQRIERGIALRDDGDEAAAVNGDDVARSTCAQLCPSPGKAVKQAGMLSLWSLLQLQLVATTASAFSGRAPAWMLWFYSGLGVGACVPALFCFHCCYRYTRRVSARRDAEVDGSHPRSHTAARTPPPCATAATTPLLYALPQFSSKCQTPTPCASRSYSERSRSPRRRRSSW